MEHDGTKWVKSSKWYKSYPKYRTDNIRKAIGMYWEDYYKKAAMLEKKYFKRIQILDIGIFNSYQGQKWIFDFIEMPEEERHYRENCWVNKTRR